MDAPGPIPTETAAALGPPGAIPPIVHRSRRARPGVRLAGLALLVVVLALAGWGLGFYPPYYGSPAAPVGACGAGAFLEGEGASLLAPLMSEWERGFGAAHPGEQVDFSPLGAGAGITALTQRAVDFAATDEPLTPAQYAHLPGPVLTLPTVSTAVAIVYHLPGLAGPIALNGSVLAQIYLGTITQWDDPALEALNPGLPLPPHPIETVHRSDAAGTTAVLTNYLADASAAWALGPGEGIQPSWPSGPAQRGVLGNSGILQYVATTPYTIGYADLPDAIGAGGVAEAALENPSGRSIAPDLTSTASAVVDRVGEGPLPSATASWSSVSFVDAPGATDYPLVAMVYLLVYGDAALVAPNVGSAVALASLLSWIVNAGQADAAPLGYVSLVAPLAQIDAQAIGTMGYSGSPLPACPSSA